MRIMLICFQLFHIFLGAVSLSVIGGDRPVHISSDNLSAGAGSELHRSIELGNIVLSIADIGSSERWELYVKKEPMRSLPSGIIYIEMIGTSDDRVSLHVKNGPQKVSENKELLLNGQGPLAMLLLKAWINGMKLEKSKPGGYETSLVFEVKTR